MDLDYFKRFVSRCLSTGIALAIGVNKHLSDFFKGFARLPQIINDVLSAGLLQLIPSKTDEFEKWSEHFNSIDPLTADELEVFWAERKQLSPNEMQQFLQDMGYNVYVHQWYVPGSSNPIVSRDPSLYINPDLDNLLVNRQYKNHINWTIECGDGTECGDPTVECGIYEGTIFRKKDYAYSSDEDERATYFYIGAQTFGEVAVILKPLEKLEWLIYKKKATHLRCVLLATEGVGIQDIVSLGNLLINGSFEDSDFTPEWYGDVADFSQQAFAPPSTDSSFSALNLPVSGPKTLSQDVELTLGTEYRLSGYIYSSSGEGSADFNIELDGVRVFDKQIDEAWDNFEHIFTAVKTTYTLTLESLGGAGGSNYFDLFEITENIDGIQDIVDDALTDGVQDVTNEV